MGLPSRIGDLEVKGLLGEGGMGRVYLCRDVGLDRDVAVKVLLPELLTNAVMRERFTREARALAKVESPMVVRVFAIGEDSALGPYVVMERLVGDDVLKVFRARGRLDIAEVYAIGVAVATGLKDAHAVGVVHRDIKPANLFLRGGVVSEDAVVITDFGLAKDFEAAISGPGATAGISASQLTSADVVVGTPAYLAPELAKGQQAQPSSDLYALGATLFHLVTGQPPFPGDVPIEVLSKAIGDPAPRARSLRPEIPAGLDAVIDALLDKDPKTRPSNAASIVDTLREAMAAGPTSPEPAATTTDVPLASSTQVMGSLSSSSEASTSGASSPSKSPPPSSTSAPSLMSAPLVSHESMSRPSTVKTATYTVMMTDIAGYTERTGRQSRDEAARWLDLHDKLLQPVFRGFGGKVIKTIGDAFMVVFSSPTDAVHCGMAIQDRLFAHNAETVVDDHIRVRVALSVGEVRVRGIVGMGGDIFGEPVNLAARIEALASPGEVLMSDGVFATMNQAEVKTEARGTHSFKGISRPVAVHAVVPSGVGDTAPFSNTTLGRVGGATAMDVVTDGAKAIGPALKRGHDRLLVLVAAQTGKDPAAVKAVVGVAAAAVAVVVVVVVVFGLLFSGGPKARIRRGEGPAVLTEFEAIPAADRSASDLVILGLANLAVDRRASGIALLKAAVDAGSDDDDIVDAAIAALDDREAKDASAILIGWGDDIAPKLKEHLSDSWWPRHHALTILDKRGAATDDDRQRVALQDVEAGDCGSRRFGLLALKRVGQGSEAIAAIRALSANGLGNLCMTLDLKGAEDAVRKRTEGK